MFRNIRYFTTSLILLFAFTGIVQADVIQLSDGSQINGEVVSFHNGVYKIRTTTMGIISLRKSHVRSISSGNSASGSNDLDREYGRINREMMNRADLAGSVNGLMKNPLVQQILNDPALMSAIQKRDWKTLQNDPKLKQLINDPQMKSITQQMR